MKNLDERQRVSRMEVYNVSQSDGRLSSSTLKTDHWFDDRGNEIKTAEPGGLVTKMKFDGAGRETKVYTTDGGGDGGWSDADDVSGDKVLQQVENTFDSDSNVILTTSKQRFHDETSTGELGNASTAPKARVSYVAQYYDAANRLTATVNVGTNGGSGEEKGTQLGASPFANSLLCQRRPINQRRQIIRRQVHFGVVLRFRNRRHLSGGREGFFGNLLERGLAVLLRQKRVRATPIGLRRAPAPKDFLVGVVEVQVLGAATVVDHVMVLVADEIPSRLVVELAVVIPRV